MRNRKRFLLLACSGAAAVAAAGVTVALGARTAGPASFVVSAGTPVDAGAFGPADEAMLARIGATGAAKSIGVLGGTAFYEIASADGGDCFAAGPEGGQGLGGGCLSGRLDEPLVDMSVLLVDPQDLSVRLSSVEGIAADGVASVAVLTADGAAHSTPVVGNLYRMPADAVPTGRVKAIVARDANGSTIFTREIGD